jgi:hypothetical protein
LGDAGGGQALGCAVLKSYGDVVTTDFTDLDETVPRFGRFASTAVLIPGVEAEDYPACD